MFFRLILLFSVITSSAFAANVEEVAFSKPWLKLLHYQKKYNHYKSKASRSEFFISKEGMNDPLLELKATLVSFQETDKACIFPARFTLLKKYWNNLIWPDSCNDFDEWYKGIDAENLYLVFSSAYPNNPASLFGHTFLRFDRKSKKNNEVAKKLLGYSIAFQAQTDSNDNGFMYTFKGMTGSYQSFLEIKPYYLNVGIYNNSESRDLWEYLIPLSKYELDLLLKHIWEISRTTTFDYYFFDENCSTLVLELIEAIKPTWEFQSKNDIFVVPQVTLNEIVNLSDQKEFSYRPAVKRLIMKRFEKMSFQEQSQTMRSLKNKKELKKITNVDQLDTLLDLWKYENYKANSRLKDDQKRLMNLTLLQRSQNQSKSNHLDLKKENKKRAPHLSHGLHKIFLNYQERLSFGVRYGFHNFTDPNLGYDEKSYINFMDLKFSSIDNSFVLSKLDLINILSLRNYYWHFPQLSWSLQSWFEHDSSKSFLSNIFNLTGGVGLSRLTNKNQIYGILDIQYHHRIREKKIYFGPRVKIGLKQLWSDQLWLILEGVGNKLGSVYNYEISGQLKFNLKNNLYLSLGANHQYQEDEVKAFSNVDFYY